MYISDFKYFKPTSLDEAVKTLSGCVNGTVLAGGTDLLVEIKNGLRKAGEIVSLAKVSELKTIYVTQEKVEIGACITHNELIKSPVINEFLPALSEAASKIGSHQIRNVGTVGGNLCTGASCADTAPVLMAYDAVVELLSVHGVRQVALKNFFFNHHKTNIKNNEIMHKIIVPISKNQRTATFEKFGLREAGSISVVSVAVALEFNENICTKANVVIGACAPTPVLCIFAGNLFVGKNKPEISDDELLETAAKAAVEASIPIDDIRASAEYRRRLLYVLTQKAAAEAIKRANVN
ncbi:MAG: CoxM [Ignavibacteria bacterium]|nr:CoxM [Ignavibacteria bacterium]